MAPLTLLLALSLFTFFPSVGDFNGETVTVASTKSVEINIAEMSPRGEDGGYAVPASGCSSPIYVCDVFRGGGCDSGHWECPPDPAGTCTVTPTTATVGQTVVRTANPPEIAVPSLYTYAWTGSDGLTGTTRIVSKEYSTPGVKTGSVQVRLGSAQLNYSCPNVTITAPAITATCSVSPTSATIGQQVTWRATASGGAGTYTYEWQGSDGLSGTTATVNKTYATAGTKTGRVRVTAPGDGGGLTSGWVDCSNRVVVGSAPVTLDLTADDYLIDSGDSTTLRWVTTNADYCNVSNGWSGTRVPNSSQSTGPLTVNTTYNMICYNDDGQSSNPDTVTVRVTDIEGRIDPCDDNYIVRQNEEFCMEYEINDPGQCVVRIGQNTIEGPPLLTSGQFDWTLNNQGRFVLYCNGVEIDDAVIKVLPEFQET